jgi:diguanylate cyclase (GGDEF)-like protein
MLTREKILESLLDLSGRTAVRSRPELMGFVLRGATSLCDAEGAVLLIMHGRRAQRVSFRRGLPEPESVEPSRAVSEHVRMLMLGGQTLNLPDLRGDPRVGPDDGCLDLDVGPAVFVPMRLRENATGYLAIYRRADGRRFTVEEQRSLTLLAAWAAVAMDNLRLAESVEKLAVTDDLTQIYNYRFLKTALRREIKRAGRFRQELSIIMIDVDNLKGYNDRHGHLRGSFLLREMAGLLSEQVRSWDLVAKYGGDEFTVILPQTGLEGTLIAAERLRSAVQEHTFPLAQPGQITISLGVATFPTDGDSTTSLIQAADRALYLAKQHGRNRVEQPNREGDAPGPVNVDPARSRC